MKHAPLKKPLPITIKYVNNYYKTNNSHLFTVNGERVIIKNENIFKIFRFENFRFLTIGEDENNYLEYKFRYRNV
jgi:hypothetical protein